jgi:hypothetical protein
MSQYEPTGRPPLHPYRHAPLLYKWVRHSRAPEQKESFKPPWSFQTAYRVHIPLNKAWEALV